MTNKVIANTHLSNITDESCDKNMDNFCVKKVKILRGWEFVFTANYRVEEVQPLLLEAKTNYLAIRDIPIIPNNASRLEESIIIKSIFGTAAIEGNPLNEKEVAEIIANKTMTEAKLRTEQEIINLREAYAAIVEVATPSHSETEKENELRDLINDDLIRIIHKMVTLGINYEGCTPGAYRNHEVQVGDKKHGGVYTPPKIIEDIETLMREYVLWINSGELKGTDPWLRAALAHYHLALIHPFGNGNGRVSRLVESYLITGTGTKYLPAMLSNYYYHHIDEYFSAFSLSQRNKDNDVTPFLKFVMQGAVDSFAKVKEQIIGFIRIMSIKVYLNSLREKKNISKREENLILILIDSPEKTFSLSELCASPFKAIYDGVSERTARRDIAHLLQKKFLLVEAGRYKINMNCLE
ncbi:MAG: Fic family protein [Deltaproteobacteria bacterium]